VTLAHCSPLAARRSHENLLDEIRRGIPTNTPTQILQEASTLGLKAFSKPSIEKHATGSIGPIVSRGLL
jgi:hypothetical protein